MVKGIVRRIDDLGRIVIPKEYRNTYGVANGDPLGMFIEGNVINLIKPGDTFVGIVRKLDELGRYTLPIEVRRLLGIGVGQKVDIYINRTNDAISICKVEYGCSWCSSSDDLIEVNGHHICITCAAAVIAAAAKVMEE